MYVWSKLIGMYNEFHMLGHSQKSLKATGKGPRNRQESERSSLPTAVPSSSWALLGSNPAHLLTSQDPHSFSISFHSITPYQVFQKGFYSSSLEDQLGNSRKKLTVHIIRHSTFQQLQWTENRKAHLGFLNASSMDRGAWQAQVRGVAKSPTPLSD